MTERFFNRKKLIQYRRRVFRELTTLGFRAASREFRCATVMAAVSGFGTALPVLGEVTGFDAAFIQRVLRRLRKSKMLVGQKMRLGWDGEGMEAIIAICCDALVADGCVVRVPDEKRSAAHRGKHGGPRKVSQRKPQPIEPYSPARVKSNPLYLWRGDEPDRRDGTG